MDAQVVVIGGGLMGLASAWRTALRGMDVLLLERGRFGHADGSSHGPTRLFRPLYEDPIYVRMVREALPLWRELERTPDSLLRMTGGLDSGRKDIMDRCAEAMRDGGAPFEWLDSADDRAPWCGLDGPFLYSPDVGIIDAASTIARLRDAARDAGAHLVDQRPVIGLEVERDAVTVRTADGPVRAGTAVIAAGAWARSVMAMAGLSAPLTVTEEQVFYVPGPADTIPLIWRGDRFFYTIPAFDGSGTIKIGDHGRGPRIDPDGRIIERNDEAAAHVSAWVSNAIHGAGEPGEAFDACLYTSTPDEHFILDARGRVIVASPCSGHGFKFGPLIGEIVACMTDGAPPPVPIDAFSLDRF